MPTIQELEHERDLPVVIADHRGIVTYVNARFETVWGWKAEDLVSQPLTTIIPPNLHDAHHLGFSRFLTTGQPTLLNRPLKLKVRMKDGRELEAEHTITAERHNGAWRFGATVRPL